MGQDLNNNNNLTTKTFWENRHVDSQISKDKTGHNWKNRLPYGIIKIYRDIKNKWYSDFSSILFWDIILPEYLKPNKNIKCIEIGSAPGDFLIQINKRYNYDVYGIEYTESGYLMNADKFRQNGLNTENVVNCDFFEERYQGKYKEKYDVVISQGFIEHFAEPENVIEKHLNVLKKDGLLIITIPRFRGIHKIIANYFDKDLVQSHNLEIMNKDKFCNLFKNMKLEKYYCDLYGMIAFNHYAYANYNGLKRVLGYFILFFQRITHQFLKLFFKRNRIETSLFSPYLIFIGRKTN